METTTLEQPETEVRIVIHVDSQQVTRLTEEIKIRQRLLNALIDAGISPNEITNINSEKYIDDVLFQKHLQLNKAMAREYASGKRQKALVEDYILPTSLEHLKSVMEAFLNYPVTRGFDKFSHLRLEKNGKYEINHDSLERECTMLKIKIYGDERIINEVKKLESQIDYLIEKDANSHQILGCGFWGVRLVCDASLACNQLPQRKFMIKKSYLLALMEQRS